MPIDNAVFTIYSRSTGGNAFYQYHSLGVFTRSEGEMVGERAFTQTSVYVGRRASRLEDILEADLLTDPLCKYRPLILIPPKSSRVAGRTVKV